MGSRIECGHYPDGGKLMKKNVSGQRIGAELIAAADGSAFTGAVTVYVTGDAGTQAVGSVGAGACTHEGNGYHTYAPAQAETNYDLIAFTFVGTGAVPVTVQVFTGFPQTGDNYARLGAPAGASVSADVAAIKSDTGSISTRIPAALDGDGNILATIQSINSGAAYFTTQSAVNLITLFDDNGSTNGVVLSDLPLYSQVLNLHRLGLRKDSALATDLSALITTVNTSLGSGAGSFANTTDSLEAIRDRGDSAWITATGFSTLDAAGIRTAVGLASANLDTQLDAIPTNSELATAIITGLTTALTEGYRGTGATGSVRDLLYEIIAHMGESSITSTTKTLKKLDGSTTAKTYTLNDATTPTAITETT